MPRPPVAIAGLDFGTRKRVLPVSQAQQLLAAECRKLAVLIALAQFEIGEQLVVDTASQWFRPSAAS